MKRAEEKSKSTPALRNSWSSIGISKRFELYPATSQPVNTAANDFANWRNVGSPATSSSVIWCMAVASAGIGISGLTRRVRSIFSPFGIIFTIEISTMRSWVMFIPVVSRSKKTMGLRRFSSIVLLP